MSKGKGKTPRIGAEVKTEKRPKRAVVGDPHADDPTVIFGLSYVDLGGPWGWARIRPEVLGHVLDFMRNFEALKQGEAFGRRHKRIELASLCPEANKRLQEIELDDLDCLWELRVSGIERIWGHRVGHVFYPIWWDPLHEVCPSSLRNT